ncbi:MAG: hypothetical protein GY861_00785, partial [bacterium]|nr:hypothetical protein [bacterium]
MREIQRGVLFFLAFLLLVMIINITDLNTKGEGITGKVITDPDVTVYVVPAITDDKILPTSSISSNYISDEISITASSGEFEPASFVIHTDRNLNDLELSVSSLSGPSGSISSENVDIKVVKVWYQSGVTIVHGSKVLTPELLLKDDSLVKIENGENYLKVNGNYVWISSPEGIPGVYVAPKSAEFPVQDSATLQPVDISVNTNKQFWITVKVPDSATSGDYSGTIDLTTSSDGTVGQIQLNLRVLPIKLSESMVTPSIYYWSRLGEPGTQWEDGTISYIYKSKTQFEAEIQNLADHGITNPAVNQGWGSDYAVPSRDETMLRKVLQIRQDAGMLNDTLYYLGLTPHGYQSPTEVAEVISVANDYGINNVYFYGVDEALSRQGGTVQQAIDRLNNQRDSWNAIRTAGGKIFASGLRQGFCSDDRWPGNFGFMGDIQDMLVCFGCYPGQDSPNSPCLSSDEAALWHSKGHQIFAYHNPQVGPEKPGKYRRNFGLALWQANYDGMMDFSYQTRMGHIWNDFDDSNYRDHVFTYPTVNGVIDTIQWEGQREGIDDVRYLTTLINTIDTTRSQGKDTSAAESYLTSLKNSDLTTRDLDTVRSEIIDHILSLQDEQESECNDGICNGDETCSSCEQDCGCPSGQRCQSGTCSDICNPIFTPWTWGYCNVTCNICGEGDGDCDNDIDCEGDLICADDVGTKYGHPDPEFDVCEEATQTCSELSGACCSSEETCTQGKLSGASDCPEKCCSNTNNCASQDLDVSFVSPTPNNGETINVNEVEIKIDVDSSLDSSAFIDWDSSLIG